MAVLILIIYNNDNLCIYYLNNEKSVMTHAPYDLTLYIPLASFIELNDGYLMKNLQIYFRCINLIILSASLNYNYFRVIYFGCTHIFVSLFICCILCTQWLSTRTVWTRTVVDHTLNVLWFKKHHTQ